VTDNKGYKPKVLVIGIGNEHRADDTFGLFVVRRLQKVLPPDVTVTEHHGEGASLMEAWAGYQFAILIDAVRSGAAPGTRFRIDASVEKVRAEFFHYSSHEFGIAEAIEMARILGQLPQKLVVFGVEGARFGMGEPISGEVEAQIDTIVDSITHEISSYLAS
jgi:hydrogenase maturation protease